MIVLHQFPPTYGLPNASPFCMKVENYLRMAGLPYRSAYGFDLPKSPKGKLPYIEDGGRSIGDSGLIIDYLKATYGDPLDTHLSAREQAVSLAFIRLMDEHLYWAACIQPRWVEEAGWKVTRAAFFGGLSGPLRHIIPPVARHNIRKQMQGHGMGRHKPAEIYGMACADITTLADYLGDKPFFHGHRPTTLDAAAYAYIMNIVAPPIDSPAKQHVLAFPNLEAYCRRMREICYPDRPE
jgi:glutathione S-transferase